MIITLPKRIVLCGVSKSGKSTLGENFRKHLGYRCLAFADPLKQACKMIFGFSDEHLYGSSELRDAQYPAFAFSGFCLRCQMQCQGPERFLVTSARNASSAAELIDLQRKHADATDFYQCPVCAATYSQHVTVREALRTLGTEWGRRFCEDLWSKTLYEKMKREQDDNFVVTDCRFTTELEQASKYRCVTVLLLRGLEESTASHQSEAELREMAQRPEDFGAVLDNRTDSASENFHRLLSLLADQRNTFDEYADLHDVLAWNP